MVGQPGKNRPALEQFGVLGEVVVERLAEVVRLGVTSAGRELGQPVERGTGVVVRLEHHPLLDGDRYPIASGLLRTYKAGVCRGDQFVDLGAVLRPPGNTSRDGKWSVVSDRASDAVERDEEVFGQRVR